MMNESQWKKEVASRPSTCLIFDANIITSLASFSASRQSTKVQKVQIKSQKKYLQ